jgi:hypothetical protein
MGKRIHTSYYCDRCQAEIGPPVRREVGSSGKLFVLELCADCDETVGAFIAELADVASDRLTYTAYTKTTLLPTRGPGSRVAVQPAAGRSKMEVAAIRQWALEQGMMKSNRGRLPAGAVTAYDRAFPGRWTSTRVNGNGNGNGEAPAEPEASSTVAPVAPTPPPARAPRAAKRAVAVRPVARKVARKAAAKTGAR